MHGLLTLGCWSIKHGPGPMLELLPVVLRQAKQVGNYQQWERRSQIVDQIHLATRSDLVKQRRDQSGDLGFQQGDLARREMDHQWRTHLSVHGWIAIDQTAIKRRLGVSC